MWFAVFLSFLLLWLQSEIIAYNLVVSGWKSLPVWLDGAFKQPEAEGKPWEPGLRRCSEENPSSLPAVHISAGFRKCLSSNLPSSTSLSQSRDFEQKKNGRNPCFSPGRCFSCHCQAPGFYLYWIGWKLWYFVRKSEYWHFLAGWFWIPFIVQCAASGAESAKHVLNLVWQHLHLPLRLQRGDPLPVHLHRLAHSLVRLLFLRNEEMW